MGPLIDGFISVAGSSLCISWICVMPLSGLRVPRNLEIKVRALVHSSPGQGRMRCVVTVFTFEGGKCQKAITNIVNLPEFLPDKSPL
jgi:hypothetical protein